MIKKRIFILEDLLKTKFMEDLFKKSSNGELYELVIEPDLSDERVYKRHLPENYDVYWLHSSSTEFEAIDEVRKTMCHHTLKGCGLKQALVFRMLKERPHPKGMWFLVKFLDIKRNQPWSKVVARTSIGELKGVQAYLRAQKIDAVILPNEGLDEKKVLQTLNSVGINLVIANQRGNY